MIQAEDSNWGFRTERGGKASLSKSRESFITLPWLAVIGAR
jgi:hypothetical protein